MITVAELAKVTALTVEEVQSGVEVLVEQNIVRVFPMKKDVYVWHEFHAKQMEEAFLLALREYHEEYPYQHGMKKAQMHVTYMKQVKQNVFDAFSDQPFNMSVCQLGRIAFRFTWDGFNSKFVNLTCTRR